jgi:hypothetical protein
MIFTPALPPFSCTSPTSFLVLTCSNTFTHPHTDTIHYPCSKDHFKGTDRVIKALFSATTAVGVDQSEYVVKGLLNCCRYSWLRLRLIEEGCINYLHSLVPGLANKIPAQQKELALSMIIVVRSMSDSSGCRQDLMNKKCVQLFLAIFEHSDNRGKLFMAKTLHNFLKVPILMNDLSFVHAVQLVGRIVHHFFVNTKLPSVATGQYTAACLAVFVDERLRGTCYSISHSTELHCHISLANFHHTTLHLYNKHSRHAGDCAGHADWPDGADAPKGPPDSVLRSLHHRQSVRVPPADGRNHN